MTAMLLRNAQLAPRSISDLLVIDGLLTASRAPADVEQVDLEGRAVVPGFADHHVHLMALAAARSSVDVSPPALAQAGGLGPALRAARDRQPDGWLRGVGYDVDGSGSIDRWVLDRFGVGPVRIQDRTGILWILDTAGLSAVGLYPGESPAESPTESTGVLSRMDAWLRTRLPPAVPDIGGVGAWLAERGVTSLTDASADNGSEELAILAAAHLPQRVVAMTAVADLVAPDGVELGPVKILLDDHRLPDLDEVTERIRAAHQHGRGAAVHCVTETQVAFALAAGIDHRDRIEHATVLSADALEALATAGPTVIVQPGLVTTRGDRYIDDHIPDKYPTLHRIRSLLHAGLRVAAGSDAPYGPADPWDIVSGAVHRRTPKGRVLGADESVSTSTALEMLSGDPFDPGTRRRLIPGSAADLVVLDEDWHRLDDHPTVLATMCQGQVIAGVLPG